MGAAAYADFKNICYKYNKRSWQMHNKITKSYLKTKILPIAFAERQGKKM